MSDSKTLHYTAFEQHQIFAQGPLDEVALRVRRKLLANPSSALMIFSDDTGKEMDLDLRGSETEMLARLKVYLSADKKGSQPTGPGRPKLGVMAREISLLPRHWEWLATQSGGASATLRRLVENAQKNPSTVEIVRRAQERTHKFMTALAGNLPSYEEALRSLYAKDKSSFQKHIQSWPQDIKRYSKKLAAPVW